MQLTTIKDTIKALAQSLQLSTIIPAMLLAFVNFYYVFPLFFGLNPNNEKAIASMVFSIITLSYILYAFNNPLIRLLEGYWGWDNFIFRPFKYYGKKKQTKIYERLVKTRKEHFTNYKGHRANQLINNFFPDNEDSILPTKIGNVIAAFEFYSKSRYGMDAVALWPRIVPTLKEKNYLEFVTEQKTIFDFLLNLFFIIIFCGLEFIAIQIHLQSINYIYIGCVTTFILAGLLYYGCINSAIQWGVTVKVAFDIYRNDLRKVLNLEPVSDFEEEKDQWNELSRLIIRGKTVVSIFNY
jgi:hypothetical protein